MINELSAKKEKAFDCIKEILTGKEHYDIFGINLAKVKPESKLLQDLGLDSLDTYCLIHYIEEKLAISIPDEKAWEFKTIRDIMIFAAKQM